MGLDENRGAGIGFNSLLVDSGSDGTPDGQELILIVLTWVTQAAPGLAPVGVAVLIGLLAGLGMSRTRRRGSNSHRCPSVPARRASRRRRVAHPPGAFAWDIQIEAGSGPGSAVGWCHSLAEGEVPADSDSLEESMSAASGATRLANSSFPAGLKCWSTVPYNSSPWSCAARKASNGS